MKMRFKIVSNDSPNEDGRWFSHEFFTQEEIAQAKAALDSRSWVAASRFFETFVPAGFHIVSIERLP